MLFMHISSWLNEVLDCVETWNTDTATFNEIFFQILSQMPAVFYGAMICDALRDLVPFVQFQKREKRPWRSVNFSKVVG